MIWLTFALLVEGLEEQLYNDYFLRLPGDLLNVASFQTKATAFLAWKTGEHRPEPPLEEALALCEISLDVLGPVVKDCAGLVLTAFRLCAAFDAERFGGKRDEARRIYEGLSEMQKEIVTHAWVYMY